MLELCKKRITSFLWISKNQILIPIYWLYQTLKTSNISNMDSIRRSQYTGTKPSSFKKLKIKVLNNWALKTKRHLFNFYISGDQKKGNLHGLNANKINYMKH